MFGGGSSLQVFRIRGIRVGVHPTWFLILFLFILWLRPRFEDAIITPGQGFVATVIGSLLFFGSIVLHELGHAFAARREGIGVAGVDLFFFGGFMRAMRDSETPGEEFRVAAAGPAVTLLLTLGFGAVGFALLGDMLLNAAVFDYASGSLLEVVIAFTALANAGLFVLNMVPAFPLDGGRITRAVAWQLSGDVGFALLGDMLLNAAVFDYASGSLLEVVIAFTALANAGLFVLNMVPAFPLDGGRITRAVAWQLSGDRHKATRFAAYLGQGFAGLMMAYGVYRFVGAGDATDGLWWIVLGWMLGGSARAAVAQSRFADRLDGVTAGDIMDAEPVTIPAELPVERAYDEYFLRYQGWPWFAVVETDGHLSGLAHRAAVEHAALNENPAQPVRNVVSPSERIRTDTPLESLIGNEPLRTLGALMAVDAEGRLRGVVTIEQVTRALQARLA